MNILPLVSMEKRYKRIFMGEETDFHYTAEPGDRCHDCGALYGYPHHDGCDAEICLVCGEQFIGCDCDIYYEDDEIEKPK